MRRFPKDQLNYFRDLMNGDVRPMLPVREPVKGSGGRIVTNTPEAVCRLFSPQENDKPTKPFEPLHAIMPEIYWEPWARPKHGIAIDDCIEQLIISSGQSAGDIAKTRSNARRVDPRHRGPYKVREMALKGQFSNLSHENGEFGGHECPYVYARWRLAEAVGLAYDDVEAHEEKKSAILKVDNILKHLKSARSDLNKTILAVEDLGTLQTSKKYKRKSLLSPTFVGSSDNRQEKSKLCVALGAITDAESRFKSHRKELSRKGRQEEIWWISFVINCGFIWTALTRVPPNLGQPGFEKFLEAAVKSLGGNRSEFLRPIETAMHYLSEMDPWDRWDAEIKGVLPPEMSAVRKYSEDKTKFVFGRFERSILNYIHKFKSGNLYALKFIEIYHLRANDDGKRLIEDLLKRHEITHAFHGTARVNH